MQETTLLVKNLKQAGVQVEKGRDGWVIKDTKSGKPVVIHRTPADRRWMPNMLAQLRQEGVVGPDFGRPSDGKPAAKVRRARKHAARADGLRPLLQAQVEKHGNPAAVGRELALFSTRTQRVLVYSRRPDRGNAASPAQLYHSTLARWLKGETVPRPAFLDLFEDYLKDQRAERPQVVAAVEPTPEPIPEPTPETEPEAPVPAAVEVGTLALEIALRLQGDPAELLPLVVRVAELERSAGKLAEPVDWS